MKVKFEHEEGGEGITEEINGIIIIISCESELNQERRLRLSVESFCCVVPWLVSSVVPSCLPAMSPCSVVPLRESLSTGQSDWDCVRSPFRRAREIGMSICASRGSIMQ